MPEVHFLLFLKLKHTSHLQGFIKQTTLVIDWGIIYNQTQLNAWHVALLHKEEQHMKAVL